MPELAKFTGLMMLTFTIDPTLFASPRDAFEYVTKHRCIAVTMQRLHRAGLLHSRRFVCVVEWQRQTEQAHWHVLVDASCIPFPKLCESWNANWKGWRERVAMGRPGFGSVRFTEGKFKDGNKAAGYVTAYLTKHPAHGYPEWVKQMETRRVHRFSTSRGFWSNERVDVADAVEHNDEKSEPAEQRKRRTVCEQLATCGKSCAVLLVREVLDETSGEVVERRTFIRMLPMPMEEIILRGNPDSVNNRRSVAVFISARNVLGEIAASRG